MSHTRTLTRTLTLTDLTERQRNGLGTAVRCSLFCPPATVASLWAGLQRDGADDDRIRRLLGGLWQPHAGGFGSTLGECGPWYARGGSRPDDVPAVWLDTDPLVIRDRRPTLEGLALVQAVRELLAIPRPTTTEAPR